MHHPASSKVTRTKHTHGGVWPTGACSGQHAAHGGFTWFCLRSLRNFRQECEAFLLSVTKINVVTAEPHPAQNWELLGAAVRQRGSVDWLYSEQRSWTYTAEGSQNDGQTGEYEKTSIWWNHFAGEMSKLLGNIASCACVWRYVAQKPCSLCICVFVAAVAVQFIYTWVIHFASFMMFYSAVNKMWQVN